MKIRGRWLLGLLPMAAAVTLNAATIDATSAATALLQPGDSLVFDIPSWNYTAHAAAYGLPLNPLDVSFTLLSAPSTASTFEAGLLSADGPLSVALGTPLTFSPGFLSSSEYSGAVATLQGTFLLSDQISQQIFDGVGAELTLRNLGPAVLIGLPNNTLPQDLFVTLSGGPLSVGALHGAVIVQESIPEPPSGAFLIVGGVLLCLVSQTCVRRPKNVKSTVCNPLGHSDTI